MILGPEIQFINRVKDELLQFANQSYTDALTTFLQTKDNFTQLNTQGYKFML